MKRSKPRRKTHVTIYVDLVLDSDGDCIQAIFGHHDRKSTSRIAVPWPTMGDSHGPLTAKRLRYRVKSKP